MKWTSSHWTFAAPIETYTPLAKVIPKSSGVAAAGEAGEVSTSTSNYNRSIDRRRNWLRDIQEKQREESTPL